MFEKIVTLSLNPAIDATLWVDSFELGGDNTVTAERYDAAGKAMNVSRALHFYGTDNLAIVVAGKHNLEKYERQLRNEKVNYKIIQQDGFIRENITLMQANTPVTRILRHGVTIESETVVKIKEELTKVVDDKTIVVISGTMPKGITPMVLRLICSHIKSLGGLISLDSASASMDDLKEIQPFIVKPNYDEACALLGCENATQSQLVDLAVQINELGVKHVLISLSGDGMIYSNDEGERLHVAVPDVKVVSAVGAGDFALAGFILQMHMGTNASKNIKTAAAMGTATCLTDATFPPQKLTTAKIMQEVRITEIESTVS